MMPLDNTKMAPDGDQIISSGENAIISCFTSTRPTWWFNGRYGLLQLKNVIEDNTLRLFSVTKDNDGYYECRGVTENGYKFAAYSKLTVM